MSAPLVTGVAALLKAQNPTRDWKAIKNLILAGAEGDMFPDDGLLMTDARLNARGAVTCANKTVVSRLRPVPAAVTAVVGQPMELSALNIRCAAPAGDVTVTVTPGGQTITLRDDGTGFDQEAGDGIYSGQWTPAAQGQFSVTFPGADVVDVQVLAGAYSVAAVPFAGRTITGTSLVMVPMQAEPIESPFPIRFAGGSFTTLFVDERGAVQFDGGDYCSDLPVYNEPLPSPFHSTLIAPFWDQIMDAAVAEVVWEVTGVAPNRELVVEWRNMQRTDRLCDLFDDFVTFQVVFFEGRSDILFNYPDTTVGGDCPDLDAGASATVGIQVSPDVATVFGFNAPVLADGMSLLWTLGQAPQPAIGVTPASANFGTVTVGSSVDATFVVKNTGNRDPDGSGLDHRPLQHRVGWCLLADRGADPGRDRTLPADYCRHVRGQHRVHRWHRRLTGGEWHRRRDQRRPGSAGGARAVPERRDERRGRQWMDQSDEPRRQVHHDRCQPRRHAPARGGDRAGRHRVRRRRPVDRQRRCVHRHAGPGRGDGDGTRGRQAVSLAGPHARRRRTDQRLGELRRQRRERRRRLRRNGSADRLDRSGRRRARRPGRAR